MTPQAQYCDFAVPIVLGTTRTRRASCHGLYPERREQHSGVFVSVVERLVARHMTIGTYVRTYVHTCPRDH